MAVYFGVDEIDFPTPVWIKEHCIQHGGGWFHPIHLTREHPLVVEEWKCFSCGEVFYEGQTAAPMPFSCGPEEGGSRWIADHRECSVGNLALTPAQRASCRPDGYESLPLSEKRWVDERLRLLEWDGRAEECDR